MKYVYMDESTFSKPKNCFGVGALISDVSIDDSITLNALTNLKNDPDINSKETKEKDSLTLNRKFFHATDDSKNAHSHLFREIMNLDCAFYCDFHDPNSDKKLKSMNEYYILSFLNTLVPVVNTKEKLIFDIEDRSGLSIPLLLEQYKLYEKQIMMDLYEQPFIQAFFPEVEFNLVNKSNAGVQCCDLLLWTINRKLNGDLIWYNRIKFTQKYTFITDSDSWGGENITIGSGISDEKFKNIIKYLPKNPDAHVNNDKLNNFFLHAIKVCEYYYHNPKSYFKYFQNDLKFIVKNKKTPNAKNYIEVLVSAYLRIFDTEDLIGNESKKEKKEFLILSKKYLALTLRKDLIHGVRTNFYLNRLRENIISQADSYLDF